MSIERKRCRHCKSPYIYHPSSYGDEDVGEYNHQDYCPDCYKVVSEALEKVPIKFEKKFIPTTKYTREEISNHQEERCKNGVPIRRIFPSYIDTTGETQHNIVCEYMPDNEWYMAQWWSHKLDEVKISVETWLKKDC